MPTIGIITQLWPPSYGGGERHLHAMAKELSERGCDVKVFCGTAAIPDRDNGLFEVERRVDSRASFGSSWRHVFTKSGAAAAAARAAVMSDYGFMEAAARWACDNAIQIAILGHPFQLPELFHTRELHARLKATGIRVGIVNYDLGWRVDDAIQRACQFNKLQWDVAAALIKADIKRMLATGDPRAVHFRLSGPLFFEPDFMITCSEWNRQFIDPLGETPTFVMHPALESGFWSSRDPQAAPLTPRDVLIVNPQSRKGPRHMSELIAHAEPSWTFRVIKGGWGNSFETFVPAVAGTAAAQQGRIDFVEFVADMREAYRAAGVLFFPSLIEGYGMTAVEPMFSGTPVVSSNHPAVVEAVGDAALTLCPHTTPPAGWRDAVRQVLSDPGPWRARGLIRAAELERRRISEADALAIFVRSMV